MAQILNFFPGQKASFFLETKDGYGTRVDSPSIPFVSRIIFPSLTLAAGYPQPMVKLDTGLYYYEFILPSGAVAVGSYLADVSYINPVNNAVNSEIYQIIVSAPYGNYSATVAI
jgi:hypothetical protein